MKISLVGTYCFGNFGDDLMAVIIGLFMQEKNLDFSVFKLCKPYAERFGFNVSNSVEELLKESRLIIWGGGGVLVNKKTNRLFPKFGIASRFPEFANEMSLLIALANKRKIPIYAFSVGGDGVYPKIFTPPYKQAFLESAEYISVRNPDDVKCLDRVCAKGDFFPDIVWQISRFFPIKRKKNRRCKVGIDIYFGNLLKQKAIHASIIIYLITIFRKDLDFVFIDTTNNSKNKFRALGMLGKDMNTQNYQFSDLPKDIKLITSLDIIISSRLHLGVVGMSYGIPFISFFGEKKTKILMKNIKLIHLYFGHRQILRFILLMLSRKRLSRLIYEFKVPDGEKLKRQSFNHLKELEKILNTLK